MWFWFRKKTIDEKKWDSLQENLKNSFTNIQKDMTELKKTDQLHDEKLQELQEYLIKLDSAIDVLIRKKDVSEDQIEEEMPELIELSSSIKGKILENLTNVQKSVLITLHSLEKEGSIEWISMRTLADELYPNKDYNAVKSMLSTYTENLFELGLINKKRKGRGTYLALTTKAAKLLPKTAEKKLKPLIKTNK